MERNTLLYKLLKGHLIGKYYVFSDDNLINELDIVDPKETEWIFTSQSVLDAFENPSEENLNALSEGCRKWVETLKKKEKTGIKFKVRSTGWHRIYVKAGHASKYKAQTTKENENLTDQRLFEIISVLLSDLKSNESFRNDVQNHKGFDLENEPLYYRVDSGFKNKFENKTVPINFTQEIPEGYEVVNEFFVTNDPSRFLKSSPGSSEKKPPKVAPKKAPKVVPSVAPKTEPKKAAKLSTKEEALKDNLDTKKQKTVERFFENLKSDYDKNKAEKTKIIHNIMVASGKAVATGKLKGDAFNLSTKRLILSERQQSSEYIWGSFDASNIFPGTNSKIKLSISVKQVEWFDTDSKEKWGVSSKRSVNNSDLKSWIINEVIPEIWKEFGDYIRHDFVGAGSETNEVKVQTADEKLKEFDQMKENESQEKNVAFGEIKAKRNQIGFMPRFATMLPILPESDMDEVGANLVSIKGQKERVVADVLTLQRGKDFTPLEIVAENIKELFSTLANDNENTLQKVREELVIGEQPTLSQQDSQTYYSEANLAEDEEDFIAEEKM